MRAAPTLAVTAFAVALLAAAAHGIPSASAARPAAAEAPRVSRHVPTGDLVVRFEPGASREQRERAVSKAGGVLSEERSHGLAVVKPASGRTVTETVGLLAEQPGVRYATPEGRVRALEALVPPDDPSYEGTSGQEPYLGPIGTYPWSVNLQPAWDRAFNGADHTLVEGRDGVRIAIIDTGVSMAYSESTGEFVPAWDYVGIGRMNPITGYWSPAKTPDADPADESGHGTAVASILRAKTANGKGIAGALHSSANEMLVYRVLDAGGLGETADFLDAIYDAADSGARVINCSLGESLYDTADHEVAGLRESYEDAVEYAWARDCVIVAAAGNETSRVPPAYFTYAPACIDHAVAVGAVDPATGDLASFSNYGPENEIDVVAGGEDISVLTRSGTVGIGSGTSFATPIVTGSLALLLSVAPSADPSTAIAALTSSGPLYPKSIDKGYGIPDIDVAYSRMTTWLPEQATVTPSASAPDGRRVTLSWSAATGADVTYAYGETGGPAYATTSRSAQVVLSAEGTRTLWLRTYATDRWSHQQTLTVDVPVAPDGLGPLDAARLAGDTRYETAVRVSRSSHPGTATAVVVASGRGWADALSAAPLAAAVDAPLLLTDSSQLSIVTRDEIARLRPERVFIVGGTGAISTTVRTQIDSVRSGDAVARISGVDRYATAALVAEELDAELGGVPGHRAFLCSGSSYADALSAAAVAGASGQPILLTPASSMSGYTATAIDTLDVTDTVIVGGTSSVSAAVAAETPSPERVSGADRYETSRAVAEWADADGVLDLAALGFARGDSYPDALSAGPFMAALGGPVVLLPSSSDAALRGWLVAVGPDATGVTVFGGPTSVTYGLENDVRLALRGQ